ncbi:MAG: DNA-directed RNA polymerase [Candidatus Nanohaloarchaeota archaeon]|nr:DNA-directed RNA polymerase [Candidatus Nanohaloarchaeota archaeon]
MYKLVEFEDTVPVKPEDLSKPREEAILESLRDMYESRIVDKKFFVLRILELLEKSEGYIYEEDPNVYYDVKAKALIFEPMLHEVVFGEVVDVANFGIFVRFGPLDALAHISQITDEYLSYDKKSAVLRAEQTKRLIKIGDTAIARIIGISLEKKETNKILLTLKQPGLGIISWLKTEKEKEKKKG